MSPDRRSATRSVLSFSVDLAKVVFITASLLAIDSHGPSSRNSSLNDHRPTSCWNLAPRLSSGLVRQWLPGINPSSFPLSTSNPTADATSRSDTETLPEAHRCQSIRPVPVRSIDQLQQRHRIREQWEKTVTLAAMGIGFGFLATVVGYLPVIYQSFFASRIDHFHAGRQGWITAHRR
jgi:hypothetical protein